MTEIAVEAAEKVASWGAREILHWLVDQVAVPHYTLPPGPTAEEVHQAIDNLGGTPEAEPAPESPAAPAPEPPPAPESPAPYRLPGDPPGPAGYTAG